MKIPVLRGTENIREIGMHDAGGTRGTLAHDRTFPENPERIVGSIKQLHNGMIIIDGLIVVGVQHQINTGSPHDLRKCGHRQHDPRVGFIRAHYNGAVELSEGIARLKVVDAEKSADLSAISDHISVSIDFKGAHIIGNYNHVPNIFIPDSTERLKCFRFTRAGIAYDKQSLIDATLEEYPHHGTVVWQAPPAHHAYVMKREHHLLEIPEIPEPIRAGHGGNEHSVCFILVKNCRRLAE